MSAPFGGPPATAAPPPDPVHDELAALRRPRKHYQWYYSTREADADMLRCPQGVHDFLRAYYHMKSADWKANKPYELASWSAGELAKMPTYYIMNLGENMPQTVAPHLPERACEWLTDDELRVYSAEFERTGFQAALQWYRCRTTGRIQCGIARASRQEDRGARLLHRRRERLGTVSAPGRAAAHARAGLRPTIAAATSSRAPGTGCNRSSPPQWTRLLLEFLKNIHGHG
jgi:hypothetical protein